MDLVLEMVLKLLLYFVFMIELLCLQQGLISGGDSHCINDGAVVITTAAFCINKFARVFKIPLLLC